MIVFVTIVLHSQNNCKMCLDNKIIEKKWKSSYFFLKKKINKMINYHVIFQ